MKTALVLLLSLLSLVSCRAEYPCKGNLCPRYEVIMEGQNFEKREYEASTWMRTMIESTATVDLIAASGRLKSFASNTDYPDLKKTWPVLINHTKDDQLWLCWFVPPNVNLSGTSLVEIVHLPASTIYVRKFGGTPSVSAGKSNAESLLSSLGRFCQNLDSVEYQGAGYESYFSFTHHNEVWISQNFTC